MHFHILYTRVRLPNQRSNVLYQAKRVRESMIQDAVTQAKAGRSWLDGVESILKFLPLLLSQFLLYHIVLLPPKVAAYAVLIDKIAQMFAMSKDKT